MSRETYCPSLIQRVRTLMASSMYNEQARKQWEDVVRQLENDCQMMERLYKTSIVEKDEDLQRKYVQALEYAQEIDKEVTEAEALLVTVGGAPKRKSVKKSSLKRKAPKRKSVKKSSLKRKAPKRKQ